MLVPAFLTNSKCKAAATYFILLTLALFAGGAIGQETEVPLPPQNLAAIQLGGQLADTVLEYVVNVADPRAGGLDTVTMMYTVPEEAWVSIGFSSAGMMIGSSAVVGFPNSGQVLKYTMSAYLQTGVLPMPEEQQTLIDTSIVQAGDGTTRMQFTKIMEEAGEETIKIGINIFIGAIGMSNAFFFHGKRDAFGIDLVVVEETEDDVDMDGIDTDDTDMDGADDTKSAADTAPATVAIVIETRNRTLWKAHGWCATLAWGFFSPLAIGAAVLRKWFPDGLWLKFHHYLNLGAGAFTIAAFGLGVAAISSETKGTTTTNHFSFSPSPHRFLGLVLFLLVSFQIASGLFRPHNPAKGEEKSCTRRSWEILHRVLGLFLLGLSWYQIHSGIEIYQTIFADSASANLEGIFWGIVGCLFGIIVVGFGITKITDQSDNDDSDDDKNKEGLNSSEEGA